jgi:hypothetical protein
MKPAAKPVKKGNQPSGKKLEKKVPLKTLPLKHL